jgi:ABC-type multidrug transport system fused ATPase/permease subunit
VQVEPGAHIGIVGRTGSGKSSLFLALFRMVELESGIIIIDGKNIATLGLTTLRKGLSMIPQDPFMFSGTVRTNLDPFAQYSDTDIWQALERVGLKKVVLSMDQKLESVVSDNGSNFSQGQRQLFCLARALLRQARVRLPSSAFRHLPAPLAACLVASGGQPLYQPVWLRTTTERIKQADVLWQWSGM